LAKSVGDRQAASSKPERSGSPLKLAPLPLARRKYISWFIDVSVDPNGDGYIGVTLHPDLKPYLLQVHRDYTRFQLGYAVRMESKYAIRLYQLLQRWAFVGKKRITLDELRLRLGARELDKNGEIMKDSLPAYKNLKQKALTPALDEINEKKFDLPSIRVYIRLSTFIRVVIRDAFSQPSP
jgi:plasmid replication initiation protein